MSIPSIAEVMAAADIYAKYPPGTGITCASEFERFEAARELLARFALAVLTVPGMSDERLAEIQRKADAVDVKYGHEVAGTGENNAYAVDVHELLAEVLRLRAMTR